MDTRWFLLEAKQVRQVRSDEDTETLKRAIYLQYDQVSFIVSVFEMATGCQKMCMNRMRLHDNKKGDGQRKNSQVTIQKETAITTVYNENTGWVVIVSRNLTRDFLFSSQKPR